MLLPQACLGRGLRVLEHSLRYELEAPSSGGRRLLGVTRIVSLLIIHFCLVFLLLRVELDPHVRDCVQTYVREWFIVNGK